MGETAYNPFSRVIEHPYEITKPDSVISDITGARIGNIAVGEQQYIVGLYEEGGEVPEGLALALNHRAFTDGTIIMQTEGDRGRFEDPKDIQENFLVKHGGRRLVAVGDPANGELVAASWLHALQGDESDVDLYKAATEFAENNETDIHPDKLATQAVRVYNGYRDRGVGREVMRMAIREYYAQWKGFCEGTIIRVSQNRKTAKFFEDYTPYQYVPNISERDDGVVYMMTTPDEVKAYYK